MLNHYDRIKTFLDAVTYETQRTPGPDIRKGRYPFITISRETGAGGHTLAKAIELEMEKRTQDPLFFQGWQTFDRELIKMVADNPNLHVSFQSLMTSEYHSRMQDFIEGILLGTTEQDAVLSEIFRMMRTMAAFGKVIIVGRGGAWVTRGLPGGLHLRLVAPVEHRIKTMMRLLGTNEKEALDTIAKGDKDRARLVAACFGKDITDPLLYNVVWNTAVVPIAEIARVTCDMIKTRASEMFEQQPVWRAP